MAEAWHLPRDVNVPVPTTEIDGAQAETRVDPAEDEVKDEQGRQEAAANAQESSVKDAEWAAMQKILKTVYDYRTPDGQDASRLFHKNVNKRNVPLYYETIKEPMALSTIKKKINFREYKDVPTFVRDFALISHNAQVFNRVNSGAYQDALIVRRVVEDELQKLVQSGLITKETAATPYLGEIPVQEDPIEEEEEEDDDEDEEEEDEGAQSDDSRKGKGKRGRRKKGERDDLAERGDGWKKKRGRPPKVDTPMEGRIKNVLKGLRRQKSNNGDFKIFNFDRLPDKAAVPDYYVEVKNPMAVDVLKKKLKRKKYQSFDQFLEDVDLMFENAKSYNTDDSQIYKDAVVLQNEAHNLATAEKAKPDSDFAMEDGRLPLPQGIEHKGEVYKVGDWCHLMNPNDLTKPIPIQIYRTWQDGAGQKYVNVCWYYRPEQTVHRFDRHFYENEIVKTGQYRDHAIDELIDRCFVMFVTRYSKGRPRNLPSDREIYVCESRYNEEKHTFNKIKTWASCLPDEVRDKDYEMDMFGGTRKIKKQPSPIAYLLKDEQKETGDVPKPEWGADNAPPKIGAVHRRPRDPKDSPPPEPTPTPPPKEPTPPPPPPKRAPSMPQPNGISSTQRPPNMNNMNVNNMPTPNRMPMAHLAQQNVTGQYGRQQQNMSPAPLARQSSLQQPSGYGSAHTPSAHPPRAPLPDSTRYPPNTSYTSNQNHKAPNPIEVYHLNDSANAQIPHDIRAQFQCDDQGRILWFTAPPQNTVSAAQEEARNLGGHSVKYLAAKTRRDKLIGEKRKREAETMGEDQECRAKAVKLDQDKAEKQWQELTQKAMTMIEGNMLERCEADYRDIYGDRWREEMAKAIVRLDGAV